MPLLSKYRFLDRKTSCELLELSVIVLRYFGVNFWGADAPQKFIRGAYIINMFFFSTCGTKVRRFFETSYYVIFGVIFFWGGYKQNHNKQVLHIIFRILYLCGVYETNHRL